MFTLIFEWVLDLNPGEFEDKYPLNEGCIQHHTPSCSFGLIYDHANTMMIHAPYIIHRV